MLRARIDFPLISPDTRDKAFWQSHLMVKQRRSGSALDPSNLGIGADPKSTIQVFAVRLKASIRQTGVNGEALNKVSLLVQQKKRRCPALEQPNTYQEPISHRISWNSAEMNRYLFSTEQQ